MGGYPPFTPSSFLFLNTANGETPFTKASYSPSGLPSNLSGCMIPLYIHAIESTLVCVQTFNSACLLILSSYLTSTPHSADSSSSVHSSISVHAIATVIAFSGFLSIINAPSSSPENSPFHSGASTPFPSLSRSSPNSPKKSTNP